jgi:D-methionine transport system substrate-binding protein
MITWIDLLRRPATFALIATLIAQSCVQAQVLPSFDLKQEIRFGTLGGPNLQILKVVKEAAAAKGLTIDIVEFGNAEGLASALDAGSLEATEVPNSPFLEDQIQRHGYKLDAIAYSVTQPMGIYARTIGALRMLKSGDTIAIPEDRINGPRALILLHNCGLLGLEDGAGLHATLKDINQNPKNLNIVEVPTGNMENALENNTAAAIPYPVAATLGLDPARDSIAIEDGHSPYAGILVAREKDGNAAWVEPLIKAYHSDEVKAFILSEFKGSIRRPW